MATKDWKMSKVDSNRGELKSWFNKKTRTYVTVFYLPSYLVNEGPYLVSVELVDEKGIIDEDFDYKFSTKPGAISWAKAYMGKH